MMAGRRAHYHLPKQYFERFVFVLINCMSTMVLTVLRHYLVGDMGLLSDRLCVLIILLSLRFLRRGLSTFEACVFYLSFEYEDRASNHKSSGQTDSSDCSFNKTVSSP